MAPTADEIKQALGLKPHPTCGFVAETYRSTWQVPQNGLPSQFDGARPLGSVLYFLVSPERQMMLHRIRNDQMYHHYLGDPLEVLLLYQNGTGEVVTIGSEITNGMHPQLVIPGGTFHVSRVRPGGSYALLGTSEWPGVEPSDVEEADAQALMATFPAMREQIAAFTRQPSGSATA